MHTFEGVCVAGRTGSSKVPPFSVPKPDDIYILSYTSGTTGDPKGVKLSHKNQIFNAKNAETRSDLVAGDAVLSYLPYTHSFEQAIFTFSILVGIKTGYYQGNPLKLVEDCGVLQPSVFFSVPRLYNKIYGSLKTKFS